MMQKTLPAIDYFRNKMEILSKNSNIYGAFNFIEFAWIYELPVRDAIVTYAVFMRALSKKFMSANYIASYEDLLLWLHFSSQHSATNTYSAKILVLVQKKLRLYAIMHNFQKNECDLGKFDYLTKPYSFLTIIAYITEHHGYMRSLSTLKKLLKLIETFNSSCQNKLEQASQDLLEKINALLRPLIKDDPSILTQFTENDLGIQIRNELSSISIIYPRIVKSYLNKTQPKLQHMNKLPEVMVQINNYIVADLILVLLEKLPQKDVRNIFKLTLQHFGFKDENIEKIFATQKFQNNNKIIKYMIQYVATKNEKSTLLYGNIIGYINRFTMFVFNEITHEILQMVENGIQIITQYDVVIIYCNLLLKWMGGINTITIDANHEVYLGDVKKSLYENPHFTSNFVSKIILYIRQLSNRKCIVCNTFNIPTATICSVCGQKLQ